MRRGGMDGRDAKETLPAEDLDDIVTLINLLELSASLRTVTNRFENELD